MTRPYDKSHHSGARPPNGGGAKTPNPSPPPSELEERFQSMHDAVIISDLSGKILRANGRATDFLGSAWAELCEMTIPEIISGAGSSLLPELCKALERERVVVVEAHCTRKEKTTCPSEILVKKLHLNEEGLVFFIRWKKD